MTKPKAKPPGVYADHVRYGRGRILAVHKLDDTKLAADMRFEDGTLRTIRLDPAYWTSDIRGLVPTPVVPKKAIRAKPVELEDEALVN